MSYLPKILLCLSLIVSSKGFYGTSKPDQKQPDSSKRKRLGPVDRKWVEGLPKALLDGFLGYWQYFSDLPEYKNKVKDNKDSYFLFYKENGKNTNGTKNNKNGYYIVQDSSKEKKVFLESEGGELVYEIISATYYQIHNEHCLKIDLAPYNQQVNKPEPWYFHMNNLKFYDENGKLLPDPPSYKLLNKEEIIRSILNNIVARPEIYEAYSIGLLPDKGNICRKFKNCLMDLSDNRVYGLLGEEKPLNIVLTDNNSIIKTIKSILPIETIKSIKGIFSKDKGLDMQEVLAQKDFEKPEVAANLTKRIKAIPELTPKLELAKIYDEAALSDPNKKGKPLGEIRADADYCTFQLNQKNGFYYTIKVRADEFMNYVMRMYIEGYGSGPIVPVQLAISDKNKDSDVNKADLTKYKLTAEKVTDVNQNPVGLKLYIEGPKS